MFNEEQFKSAVRWALTLLGTFLTTHGVISGGIWEPIAGAALSLAPFIWSMIRHTKVGTLLAADALPEVQGIVTKSTVEGVALATETPSPTVVPAGSAQAVSVAKA